MSDDEILALWSGDSTGTRPVMGKNKVLTFARALEARIAANGAEPVAYTSPDRLARIAKNSSHVDTMWGNALTNEGENVALYATPVADSEELSLRAQYDDACIAANKNAKDAGRYRWWRNWVFRAGDDGLPTCTYLADVEQPGDIDSAIDAAMAASAEKGDKA